MAWVRCSEVYLAQSYRLHRMDREEALQLVRANVSDAYLLRHALAVESIMVALAEALHEDVNLWGVCGLLHDIDYEVVKGDPKRHGIVAEVILQGKVDERVTRAIRAHNGENTGTIPDSPMAKCLISADSVSGLLVASALVMPSKKLKDLKLSTLKRKFKDKDFAKGCSRERISMCESIGVPIERLLGIALEALRAIGDGLGL